MAVNPLFVWYSQEARAYGLFVLMAALAMLCFVRAAREPTPRRMAAFALSGSLALLTHYFAVFLLIGMALWLLRERRVRRRPALPALRGARRGRPRAAAADLRPGGHGTQWIGRWALSSRLQAIPQYYLTGYSARRSGTASSCSSPCRSSPGVVLGAWRCGPAARPPARRLRGDGRREDRARLRRGAQIALLITATGVLGPIVLVAFGADYLAPRNLVGAMIPLSVLIAILLAAVDVGERTGDSGPLAGFPIGVALAATIVLAFLVLSIDVDLSPAPAARKLARRRAGARRAARAPRAITTVELGAAPLEYYLPPCTTCRARSR